MLPRSSHHSMAKKETKISLDFPFGRENYILMFIGIGFIFIGFWCMSGGATTDPKIWNPELFSFRRITLAPILVIMGFIIEAFAILKKSKS